MTMYLCEQFCAVLGRAPRAICMLGQHSALVGIHLTKGEALVFESHSPRLISMGSTGGEGWRFGEQVNEEKYSWKVQV